MKHVFVINQKAGQGEASGYIDDIENEASSRRLSFLLDDKGVGPEIRDRDVIVYVTKSAGDATKYVKAVMMLLKGEKVRFYAIGGDGTLSEVINGLAEEPGVEVAHVAVGTGNDFVRSIESAGNMLDISSQMSGTATPCDLIKYKVTKDGEQRTGYVINMINIGLDCNVVDLTSRVKKLPLIRGSFAYYVSVLATLIAKKGADLKVIFDDGTVHDGKLMLIAIANGKYCGGGVKGVPKAEIDDGRFDVSLVEEISRREFIRLYPYYQKGTHLDLKSARPHFTYRKCKELTIKPNKGVMKLCCDGEISVAEKLDIKIVPAAIKVVVPKE